MGFFQPGNCRGHSERWYFDEATGSCLTFSYTGCYGNRNNFASRSKCEATCLLANQKFTDMSNGNAYWTSSDNQDSALAPNNNEADSWKNLQALSFIREVVPEAENNFSQPEPIPEPEVVPVEPPRPLTPFGMGEIDCQISAWSTWSDCSTSCGTGWQLVKRWMQKNGGSKLQGLIWNFLLKYFFEKNRSSGLGASNSGKIRLSFMANPKPVQSSVTRLSKTYFTEKKRGADQSQHRWQSLP